ncbi:centromere-associated protein E isoform X2 [Toxorhynchites rutilus septentrionalis]|uniref:centromere-associated protein E isoform X2 n=1 Tax=Toxorhynchites rutilus septentrionalis TaxID=329112 RepID=UPI00247AE2DA|nr:centromere-associated protein E isoform X2 [Toxorhynchites rutilus septentrionalis]
MDGLRWTSVLLQWVKDSKLVSCEQENIEQCSVDDFYQQFRDRMQTTLAVKEANIIDFLKEHFPHYELYLTESGQIAAPDHFYIFSLLLYFSCVRHPERFFQLICNGFDKPKQYAVTGFLKFMHEGNHLRKEIDRTMIRKAIQDAMPKAMMPPSPPQPSLQQLSQSSRLTSSDIPDSPLRLNSRLQRISPPTPKTIILDERTRQLKELKAQLEAERYEKGYLEVQLKQLQDKNDKFLEDKRKYLKEIRELKAELQTCNRENESPNKQRGADHKLSRIERQLAEKEAALDQLKVELETVSENNKNATEMINYRNTQIVKLKDKIQEQEASIVTLSECVEEKELMIKYLRESNDDLQNFIKENRLERDNTVATDTLNTSFECLELNSATSSSCGTGGKFYSPENMATVVVDVQLKEKEAENDLLKRSLEAIEQEKVRVSGLVGHFFRLYGDIVGKLPEGVENPYEVAFANKMNIFKSCYETLFEEYGKFKESKGALEVQNGALEENVRQLKTEVIAISGVLRKLECHSAEIEKDLAFVKQTANEYQQHNATMEEELRRQKVDFLKLISEKDSLHKSYQDLKEERESLSQQNLTMNVELNSLRGDHESIMRQIDYLMVSINEDYEGSDFSSWFEKMDDLKDRLSSLKEDKERLTAINMKIMVEKIALEKEISNGEMARQLLLDEQSKANRMVGDLNEQTKLLQAELDEKNRNILALQNMKTDLEINVQNLCEELLEVQGVLKKTEEMFELGQKDLQSNRKQLQICEKELATAKDTNSTLNRELDEQRILVKQLERIQQEHVDKKTRFEDKIKTLEKEVKQAHSELNHLNKQHDEIVEERNRLSEEIMSREENCVKHNKDFEENLTLVQKLEMRVQDLQDSLNRETEKADRERTEKDQLKLELNHLFLSGLNLFQDNITRLESQYVSKIELLRDRLGQLSALLAKLSAQQYKLRLEKNVIEQNLVQMMEEYESMQDKNEAMEKDKVSLQQALLEVQAEKRALEEHKIETQNELTEMRDMLETERNNVEKMKSELEALLEGSSRANEERVKRELELEHKLHSEESLTEQLRREIDQARKDHTNLESLVEEKTEHLQLVSSERDELNDKRAKLEVRLTEVQEDLASQKQLTTERSNEAKQLETQLESNRAEFGRLNTEINRLETDLAQCQSRLVDQQKIVAEKCRDKELLEEKINELATNLANVRTSKKQQHERAEELSCQLEKMQQDLRAAADEFARKAEQHEQLASKQTALLHERDELAERVEDMTESMALLEEDRDTLREEKCRLEAEVERIDDEREALGEQCGKLLGELSKDRAASADARKVHEQSLSDLNQLCGKLERDSNASKQHQERLVEKIRDLEQTKHTLESALSSKGTIENKVSELSQMLEDLRSEKCQLESERSSLLQEQKMARERINSLELERTQLRETGEQLKQQIASVEGLHHGTEKELESITNAHVATVKQNQNLNNQIKQLSETIVVNQIALDEKHLAKEKIREQLEEAQQSLEVKSEEITSIKQQLLERGEEIQRLRDESEKRLLSQSHLLEKAETEKQSIVLELEKAKQTILDLESKTAELSRDLRCRSADFESEKKEAESRAERITAILASLDSSENACKELREQLQTLSSLQESATSRALELQNEIDTRKASHELQQQNYEQLKNRYLELSTSEGSIKKQLEQLESSIHSKDSELELLKQEISQLNATNHNLQTTVDTKNAEILQLTGGLEKIKTFQSQLELKVSDFESVVAEKDEMELHSIKLQNEFDLLSSRKLAMASELEQLRVDKLDVDRRLLQQLQEYDKLNEALLEERELREGLEKKQRELHHRMQTIVESTKSELAFKDKKLAQKEEQLEKLKRNIDEGLGKDQRLSVMDSELTALKAENIELQAAKEKLLEAVEEKAILEKSMQQNMEHLRESLKSKQITIDTLNSDVSNHKETMHTLKIENGKLRSSQELQQSKILNFELKISEQAKKIRKLEETLSKTEICHLEDNSKASTLLQELEQYKEYQAKVQELEELHQKEREINKKCMLDNDILKAKLIKHRKMSEDSEQQFNRERLQLLEKVKGANKDAEEKMKEIRIEYEAKLEKMKDKMKSLYAEEMQKTTRKHEKDLLELRAEIQQETKKFDKMEIHSKKLQQQLSILNEKNLEVLRENEYMKSKLRVMEEIREERKSMLPPPPAHARLGPSLKMEDEEGEIFNNTYLTDLKTGRMSPPFTGRDSIRYSELVQRNSMVLPHLRSSYLPQYVDEELTDDDIRDAASANLDDSSTSLIARKKVGGTTSYKRPGPPTPSKKAGRLSFGGSLPTNDFQYKEFQKDNTNGASSNGGATLSSRLSFGGRKSIVDSTNAASNNSGGGSSMTLAEMNARKKTPGKFKQMFSSSNLLNTLHKDETPAKRELSSTKLQQPSIVKINCGDDDRDSMSFAAEEKRARFRSKRDSTPVRALKEKRTTSQLRKAVIRFDKNRRLSSVESDSPAGSPRVSGDPYGGFSYDGTPDRIKKIDINSMSVFTKGSDRQLLPSVVVFNGDKKDDNNNSQELEHECLVATKLDHLNPYFVFETSDFVHRLCTRRRDKQRRKSRDQRRESFNRFRNINGDAIVYRSREKVYADEAVVDSTKMFESLLEQKVLDRPSEIFPRDARSCPSNNVLFDPFDQVVSSSTGMHSVANFPLLERFSEIFRVATLQRTKTNTAQREPSADERPVKSDQNSILLVFVGVLFTALIVSIYFYYFEFRTNSTIR